LGEVLGLSRPTLSAAIAELDQIGLVAKIGEVQGSIGRKAALYRAGPGAGHVIAIDAGSTHVRLRVSTIDRRLLHSRVYRLPASQLVLGEEISQAVADEVAATLAETEAGWGPLRMLGIAVPSRVVGPRGDRVATRQQEIFSRFEPPANVPLVLENNVNCAAVAERSNGIA
jgi:predicted NBD/HSP70 family sugar kinase